ncbi:MAG: M48 family metallopeptidase [Myxococcota bacterium]
MTAREEPGEPKPRLRTFSSLDSRDFVHPWETEASANLRRVPGLDFATKKAMELGLERIYYLQNIGDNVRVTSTMFPRLHRYLNWGCEILKMPVPELYVSLTEEFGSRTYGHDKPFIVLGAELVEMLDEEERFYVIAHELGHIKAEHMLYTILAENTALLLDLIGKATFGLGSLMGVGLAIPLLDWYRKAALTADRAALLCVQDVDVPVRVFMKLAGGATGLYSEMDKEAFLQQIRSYEDREAELLDRAYRLLITVLRSSPFPIMRTKHLDEWVRGGGYARLLSKAYGEVSSP